MSVNPGTFHIPEEYAVVQKPVARRSSPHSPSVPDRPPQRVTSSSTIEKKKSVTKKVGFVDDPPAPPDEAPSIPPRPASSSVKAPIVTPPRPAPSSVKAPTVTSPRPAPSSVKAPFVAPPRPAPSSVKAPTVTSPRPTPSSVKAPFVAPPRPAPLSHGDVEDSVEVYGQLSESFSGGSRSTGRHPPYLNKTKSLVNRTSSVDYVSPSPKSDEQFNYSADGEDVALRRNSSRKPKGPDCLDVEVFLTEQDNMLRGVLELSTLHHDVIDKVKLRVVCLFDVSGSMMLKCGRSRQHSKLTKLKKMASDLVDVLEDGDDFVGLVAFGEGTRVVSPLTRVDSKSRVDLKEAIATVDKGIDSKTDLVNGVLRAIEVLKSGQQAHDPSYRNAIVVFSDGEINAGEMDPDKVVHAVRQRIRDTNPRTASHDSALWTSVACVTTGGNVSEAMYLVSKYCGNDAYYYVDSDLDHPEVDMLIPLLLRKSAIAQFVTIDITSDNGAKLILEKCTREHSVRRRREEKKPEKMIYFLHDIPAGSQKHFSIAVDLANYSRKSDSDVICINLEYVDASGETRTVKKTIRFGDSLTPLKDPDNYEKNVFLSAKADMRNVFQNSCRDAADIVGKDDESSPSEPLNEGKVRLHQLMEQYGRMAKREETKTKVEEFTWALVENLDKLIESMEKSRRGTGHKWTKIKAVSSAVVRETPNVSKLVAKSETVCPLPIFKSCETTRMTALALKLYRKQEVTSVVFPNQNLFDAAKVVMQSLGDIVNVLNEVEKAPSNSMTLRRQIINSMVIEEDDLSDD